MIHTYIIRSTCQKNPFATPRTVLQRAKKSFCNRKKFRTLFLPHRFIKIRPAHQRPVSIEFLTICRNPEFPKSEQNRKSCGNVRIWRKRAAIRRKNDSNLNKNFVMNLCGGITTTKQPKKRFWRRRRLGRGKKLESARSKDGNVALQREDRVCVLLCFIKPILGNHYVWSRGFIVSEPMETYPRSKIVVV